MSDSIYDQRRRVRPPRVHISYEVEIGSSQVMKELPFVVGVVSDLSGHPSVPLDKPMDRKFTDVDKDNFDDVLKSMAPRLAIKTENTLTGDGSELSVELNFEKFSDFNPENVARQIAPLSDLMEVRRKLRDLLSKTEGNDRLEELLNAILESKEVRAKLSGTWGEGSSQDSEDQSGDSTVEDQ